jgi:hypothetical protein
MPARLYIRIALLLAFLAPAFAQTPVATSYNNAAAPGGASDPQSLARLEGRVISVAGDPLRKATVRMQMMTPARTPGATGQPPAITNYTSTSDNDGNFLFEDLQPGRFDLSAERNGYVRASYGSKGPGTPSTPITLSAGQKLTGILLKLQPQALIAGKITDEDGDPIPNAQVQLQRYMWNQGRRQLMPMNSTSTQADGGFMMGNLAAGRYFLSATDNRANMFRNARERPGRRGQTEEYVTTYYPNAIDPASAAPIELTSGVDVRGIELRLRKARVFRVSGRALHSGGLSPSGAMLMLQRLGSNDFNYGGRNMAPIRDKDGWFEFVNVSPGQYLVQTQPGSSVRAEPGAPNVPMLGRAQVNVGNEDVENVVITLGPGADVTGQLILEGVGPLTAEQRQNLGGNAPAPTPGRANTPNSTPASSRMMFQLIVAEGVNFGIPGGQIKDDGTFLMKNVQPDKFRMSLGGVPPGCYIKAIRFGGQDVTHTTLDLTGGAGGHLDIVISPNAAEISGIVRNDKGEAAADMMITLWSPEADMPGSLDPVRQSRTDATGNFKFSGLPPGDYRIAAWERIEPGMSGDPDFRKKFDSSSTAVKVREGARENLEVKLISGDAIEAEAAKMR